MGPIIRSAALLSGFVLASPSVGLAAPIVAGQAQTWSYETSSCPTCHASVIFELLAGGTSLKITLENTSTDGLIGVNILTALGFDTVENLSGLSILSQQFEGDTSWKLGNGVGSGNWEIGLTSNNGINHGLDNQSNLFDSGWIMLGWSAPLSLTSLTIQSSVVKFQASTLDGQSVHGDGSSDSSSSPGTAVPEPSSLLLCATGAAIAFRRARGRLLRSAAVNRAGDGA